MLSAAFKLIVVSILLKINVKLPLVLMMPVKPLPVQLTVMLLLMLARPKLKTRLLAKLEKVVLSFKVNPVLTKLANVLNLPHKKHALLLVLLPIAHGLLLLLPVLAQTSLLLLVIPIVVN